MMFKMPPQHHIWISNFKNAIIIFYFTNVQLLINVMM
jgi:hypothetical protein